MEAEQIIGPSGPEVPNSYTISLHPKDFERFAHFKVALQREVEKYLAKHARERGWQPVSSLRVQLTSDLSARQGRPSVLARMLDVADHEQGAAAAGDAPLERTRRQPRISSHAAVDGPGQAGGRAELVSETGERFFLGRPVVTIGRALENDVVIPDTRVSRFHAEIRRDADRYLLTDLGSTNGTEVGQRSIDRCGLRDGDAISLGGYRLTFRQH
jgi:hypothetical protein